MNRILLFILAATGSLTAASTTLDFTYNYDGQTPYGYGFSASETYDVAVKVDAEGLVGKKIIGIKVPFQVDGQSVSDISGWLSTELMVRKEGSAMVNAPDLTSVAADIGEGVLYATFDTPYEVTENGVYVGYTFTILSNTSDVACKPVAVVDGTNENGLWIHSSAKQPKWSNYSVKIKANSAMTVIMEGDFYDNAATSDLGKSLAASMEAPVSARIEVINQGIEPIRDIEYSYRAGSSNGTGTFHFDTPVVGIPSCRGIAEITIEAMPETGTYPISVSIDKVNGQPNRIPDPVTETELTTYIFYPKYRPLVEEYTGLHCGYCPMGYVMLEQMKQKHGSDFVAISYHSSSYEQGCMVCLDNGDFPMHPGAFPNASLNRGAMTSPDKIPEMWYQTADNSTSAEISMVLDWADDAHTRLKGDATVRFNQDYDTVDYRLSFALIADGLSDKSWVQANYYTDYEPVGEYAGPFWNLFVGQPENVRGLVFNDILVYYKTVKGIEESLPRSIKAGETYEFSYEIEVSEVRNVYGEEIVSDFDRTRMIGIVLNGKTGKPVNCCTSGYTGDTGVSPVLSESSAHVVDAVYYDLNGNRVVSPVSGIYVRVDTLEDGGIRTSKIVIR